MGRRQSRECHSSVRTTTSVPNGGKVVYPSETAFGLETFQTFIECYFFLCKVADHVAEEVNEVFESWNSQNDELELRNNLRAKSREVPWRPKYKPRGGPSSPLTLPDLGDDGDSGSGGVQGEMECIEMEDWELTEGGVENKRPGLLTEGDRLVRANLQVLNKAEAYEADLDGRPINVNGIRQWIQTIDPE